MCVDQHTVLSLDSHKDANLTTDVWISCQQTRVRPLACSKRFTFRTNKSTGQ